MRTNTFLSGLLICTALAAAAPALAAPIGSATKINPSVTGTSGGRAAAIAAGDDVMQDETVQTGPAGEAKLRFVDSTNLTVGPGSNIKLDKFVFAGGATASSVVLSTARGAFRFTTGNSAHEAYRINTPAASIGVRGTQFSFTVRNGRLNLSVEQGVVNVCPRGKGPSACVDVRPGQSVQARAGAPAQVFAAGGGAPPDDPPPPRRRARHSPPEYQDQGEPPPRRRRVHRLPPPEYDDQGYPPPQEDYPPPPRRNPLGGIPQLGLELGIPLIFGGGRNGGGGGRRPDYPGNRLPCQYGECAR